MTGRSARSRGGGLAARLERVARWEEELASELHHRRWSGGNPDVTLVYVTVAWAYVRAALKALHVSTPPLPRGVRVRLAVATPVWVVAFGAILALLPGSGPFQLVMAVGAASVLSEAAAVGVDAVDRRRTPPADATLLPAAPAGDDPVDAALRRMRDRLEEAISAQPEPTDDSRRQALASARKALACLTAAIDSRD